MNEDPRLAEMQASADHARARHALYKAKSYGPAPTSAERLRDLKREADRSASALSRAQAAIATDEERSHA